MLVGWHTDPNNEIHPFLAHYQTWNGADAACDPVGTTGVWNAASGRSTGWEDWSVDLSQYAGSQVEVSISYVSDWGVQGIGVFLDDITVSSEVGTVVRDRARRLDGGRSRTRQRRQPHRLARFTDVGFEEGAVTTMTPTDAAFRTIYFGFGFEGITSADQRSAVMGSAINFLLAAP